MKPIFHARYTSFPSARPCSLVAVLHISAAHRCLWWSMLACGHRRAALALLMRQSGGIFDEPTTMMGPLDIG